jgi:hypothetical protein
LTSLCNVPDAGLLPRSAHAARADAHLDDIGAGKNQLLDHLPRHHVARNDGVVRLGLPHPLHGLDEEFTDKE